MKAKIVFLAMLIIVSSVSIAQAEEIEVVPEVTTMQLIAGETIVQNVTITFNCNNPIVLNLSTEVYPDGDGINITFYNIPIDIRTGIEYEIQMVINTSMLLMPGVYTIKLMFSCECEQPSGGGSSGSDSTNWNYSPYGGEEDDEQEPETTEDPAEEQNEEDNEEPEEIDSNDGENKIKKLVFWIVLVLIAILIVMISILASYEIKKRKESKKKEEQKNEQNK